MIKYLIFIVVFLLENFTVRASVVSVRDFGAIPNDGKIDNIGIQKALDAKVDSVIFPEGTYNIDVNSANPGIYINNNTVVILNGAILKTSIYTGTYSSCINVINKKNVRIIGGILIGDRDRHDKLDKSEWGFGVKILGGNTISLMGTKVKSFWGDGIYINDSNTIVPTNIVIENVECNSNRRNGLSIICVDNISIKMSRFLNSNGTSPMTGIDVEPNSKKIGARRIVIKNNFFAGNRSRGILISGNRGPISETSISENTFNDTKFAHIQIRGYAEKVKISNNTFKRMSSNFSNVKIDSVKYKVYMMDNFIKN